MPVLPAERRRQQPRPPSFIQTPPGSNSLFLSIVFFSFTTPHPFCLILGECATSCFPAKSNHVSLSYPWSWLTNAFSSKGQVFFAKESPCYLLSHVIRSVSTLPSPPPSLGVAISFQNSTALRPSGVSIRSATTQSTMVSYILYTLWGALLKRISPRFANS